MVGLDYIPNPSETELLFLTTLYNTATFYVMKLKNSCESLQQ